MGRPLSRFEHDRRGARGVGELGAPTEIVATVRTSSANFLCNVLVGCRTTWLQNALAPANRPFVSGENASASIVFKGSAMLRGMGRPEDHRRSGRRSREENAGRAPQGCDALECAGNGRRNGFSAASIHRIWQTFGLQPHRSETFKLSTDPLFVEKVAMSLASIWHPLSAPSCSALMKNLK